MTVGFPLTASAEDAVTYTEYSWDDRTNTLSSTTKTITDYTIVTGEMFKTHKDGLNSGNYVVIGNVTVSDYFYIRKNQTVNLIVQPGTILTCKKGIGCGYDKDGQYSTLNIYGTGKIVATGKKYYAGIGGRDNETSGNINIHGTTIEAKGGSYGAGIGGGDEGKKPDYKTAIKIYAGNITATGGSEAAGIGGNEQPGARTYIYGGNITATSKKLGAGIGGGDEEGTMGIWIYDGTVNATGGESGAGIGAGEDGGDLREAKDGGGVNILGGNVTAKGGKNGARIGGGRAENMSGTITIKGDDTVVYAIAGIKGGAGIGASSCGGIFQGGNMGGTITINCGKNSSINAYGIDKKIVDENGSD